MSYTIMQMPSSLWHAQNTLFTSDSVVKREDYCTVYQGDTEEDCPQLENPISILEKLFEIFNIHHPEYYAGRSLSAGDIVMIDTGDQAIYYLCCSFGWHQLENF